MIERSGSTEREIVAGSASDKEPLRTRFGELGSGIKFIASSKLAQTFLPTLGLGKDFTQCLRALFRS